MFKLKKIGCTYSFMNIFFQDSKLTSQLNDVTSASPKNQKYDNMVTFYFIRLFCSIIQFFI